MNRLATKCALPHYPKYSLGIHNWTNFVLNSLDLFKAFQIQNFVSYYISLHLVLEVRILLNVEH